ncbi:hypothetical protein [Reinekea sp. G2M2-21]|uniref:hypothetical protein n=1 Tax=Reinekea sp. G2M2-21 TaxID=2788942 RepID=UPI0018A8E8AD|nr:hypothetical protein [Reinekea sp. G2M2-21]
MNPSTLRRTGLIVAAILFIVGLFLTINLMRFSPEQWLRSEVGGSWLDQASGTIAAKSLGTALEWQEPSVEWQGYAFTAESVQVRFNWVSVLIGKPNLKDVRIASPYLQVPLKDFSVQQLRTLMQPAYQQMSITNGLLVAGDHEVHDITLSMTKNGVFGEYAVQLTGELTTDDLVVNLTYSTLLGIDGNNLLVMGKTQFDASVAFQNWMGRIAGKIKTLTLAEDYSTEVKFLNWSSGWRSNADFIPYTLDWAGGLTQANYAKGEWQFTSIDTAIAYEDDNKTAHTFALQSNQTSLRNGDLDGQLGLSLLTEFPLNSEWQSYNLVMSGTMLPGKSIFEWADPDIRLSMFDNDTQQHTHYIKVRELNLSTELDSWQLLDGDWRLVIADIPAGDFGFGAITGQWPSLQITDAPQVAEQLQPALNAIAPDVEYLNALFTYLVP